MADLGSAFDRRTTNTLWSSVLVETLSRLGLAHVVLSPGSRSTPLALAFARHPRVSRTVMVDERSAAFFALGLARRSRLPVALLCTSGSAVANYFPAVVEAHEAGVPLLLLTADRPPEMRACHSGQTIDQQKIFGDYVCWQHEVAVPEATLPLLRYLRQTVVQAWRAALGVPAGPVHLNLPFRDPLAPPVGAVGSVAVDGLDDAFFAHLEERTKPERAETTTVLRVTTPRGLIVAGQADPADPAAYVRAVLEVSARTGWPVLADALSPVRYHAPFGAPIVTTYDTLLRDESLARTLVPEQILCLGGWPTSKVLRTWLERSGAQCLLLAEGAVNRDALHLRTEQRAGSVERLTIEGASPAADDERARWLRLEADARSRLDATLAAEERLFEGKAAWLLARTLPSGVTWCVASSMPVRDLEYFVPASAAGLRVQCSRGANGIDGTLSTALGAAEGGPPAVLLTGDLAFLHDSNGLLAAKALRGSLTVILINNDGGGIFEHLPIAAHEPPFEELFATPQTVDIGALVRAHGVEHRVFESWRELESAVKALPLRGVRVWELRTDRKRDARQRKELFARVAAEVAAAVR
jgi:2-succinyl-5-enolpyruvyl-6-hydroxy-3-cyclohexene-1-carboxylate synthase